MKIRKFSKEMTMSAFLVLLLAAACFAVAPKKHVSIAVFPCTDAVMSFKKFHLLVSYLQEETGLDVSLSIPRNYAEFERAVRNGDIDFAFQDPHIYVRLAGLYDRGALVRALSRKGAATQAGVVIARKDSGIGTLADLKGKTVMFGPRLSAARWLAAKSLFEENGLDIDRDFKAYSNGRCCEDIAFSVYLGAVDAGVVCDHFLGEHSKKQKALGLEAKQIAVVCKTSGADPDICRPSKAGRRHRCQGKPGTARAGQKQARPCKDTVPCRTRRISEVGGRRLRQHAEAAGREKNRMKKHHGKSAGRDKQLQRGLSGETFSATD